MSKRTNTPEYRARLVRFLLDLFRRFPGPEFTSFRRALPAKGMAGLLKQHRITSHAHIGACALGFLEARGAGSGREARWVAGIPSEEMAEGLSAYVTKVMEEMNAKRLATRAATLATGDEGEYPWKIPVESIPAPEGTDEVIRLLELIRDELRQINHNLRSYRFWEPQPDIAPYTPGAPSTPGTLERLRDAALGPQANTSVILGEASLSDSQGLEGPAPSSSGWSLYQVIVSRQQMESILRGRWKELRKVNTPGGYWPEVIQGTNDGEWHDVAVLDGDIWRELPQAESVE